MIFMAGNLESFTASTTYIYDLVKLWGEDAVLTINNAGTIWRVGFLASKHMHQESFRLAVEYVLYRIV
jgi:hypothetical protein